jgi:hypothetical protein
MSLSEEQLPGQRLHSFGTARRGTKVVEPFKRGIDAAIEAGKVVRDGDALRSV